MENRIKTTVYLLFILLSIFISSCNGQTKPQQESANTIVPLTAPQENTAGIQMDTAKQTMLNFSQISGHFDTAYSNVHNGLQDKAGNIWFGTTGAGAICFNGKYFTHITAKNKSGNNVIAPLLEDTQGNIWFAGAGGIYRYDGKSFTSIPTTGIDKPNTQTVTLNGPLQPASQSVSVIAAMQDSKGNIWFSTETSGVYRYDGKNFSNILSQKDLSNSGALRLHSVTGILEDKKGNIWFASWNNEGLCRYDGKSITSFTPKNGLGDDMIYSIYEDETGNLWIGTRNHGVWRYDGKSFTDISAQTPIKSESIYSIRQDNHKTFWFATQSKGVWKYDGKTFTNFTTKDGLHNNSVFCIVPDKNGNLWFGSRGLGLSVYDGKTFTDYTKE